MPLNQNDAKGNQLGKRGTEKGERILERSAKSCKTNDCTSNLGAGKETRHTESEVSISGISTPSSKSKTQCTILVYPDRQQE